MLTKTAQRPTRTHVTTHLHPRTHAFTHYSVKKKCDTLLDLCVSSLRRGHANLLCIVPILTDDLRRGSKCLQVWLCSSPALSAGRQGLSCGGFSAQLQQKNQTAPWEARTPDLEVNSPTL